MTWHYVIARERLESGEFHFSIREYFHESTTGGIGWTEDPIAPAAEDLPGLIEELQLMHADAINRPILDLTLDPPRLIDRALV